MSDVLPDAWLLIVAAVVLIGAAAVLIISGRRRAASGRRPATATSRRLRRSKTASTDADDVTAGLAAASSYGNLSTLVRRARANSDDPSVRALHLLTPDGLPVNDDIIARLETEFDGPLNEPVVVEDGVADIPDDLLAPGATGGARTRRSTTSPSVPAATPAWTATDGYSSDEREPTWRELGLPEDVPTSFL